MTTCHVVSENHDNSSFAKRCADVDVRYWISGLDQDNQTRLLYLLKCFLVDLNSRPNAGVQGIIDSVVKALRSNPNRR
jgi:hypothetical protein